jgi:hypothetical protein
VSGERFDLDLLDAATRVGVGLSAATRRRRGLLFSTGETDDEHTYDA